MIEPLALEFGLARAQEVPSIASMARDFIEEGLDWRWRNAEIRKLLLDPDAVVLCARRKDSLELCAFAAMRYEMEQAHLLLLAVLPAVRRRGIAAHLMHWLERTARTAGISRIRLEVRAGNETARAFYRHLGFRELEYLPRYYSTQEAAMRMECLLGVPDAP